MARVLVVDDEYGIRNSLEHFLKKDGHEVATASNHEEAMECVNACIFGVVITDIIMPRESGIKLLEDIRATCPNVQVILMTGEPTIDTAQKAVRMGAFDYLTKPIKREDLLKSVAAASKMHSLMVENQRYSEKLEELVRERTSALLESENRWRSLVQNAPDVIVNVDNEGKVLYANRNFLGIDVKKLHGEKLIDLFPSEKRDKIDVSIQYVIDNHVSIGFVDKFDLPGSSDNWFSLRFSPVRKEDQVDSVIIICSEITEKIQAETALQQSEERYRSLFYYTSDAILLMGEKNFTDCNNAAIEMFGGKVKSDIIGHSPVEFSPERQPDAELSSILAGKWVKKAFEEGSVKFDWQHVRKDGTPFFAQVILTAFSLNNEKLLQVNMRDITELIEYRSDLERRVVERTEDLKQALLETEEARDRIDGILKSVADGLIVTDVYNRVLLMNRAAEDMLNVRLTEVIARPIDFAIMDETLRDRLKITLNKKQSGYEFDFILPGYDKDLAPIMRAGTSVIYDKDGNETGIVTIMHDVTHERMMDRMKTEFVSTSAHELRTPLTSIQGFSELLITREDLTDEERQRFLRYINEQAVKLGQIINDLLDVSRMELGKGFQIRKERTRALQLIEEIEPYVRGVKTKHVFEISKQSEDSFVMVDRGKMDQVMKNIISNAVKYSPDGGVIRISGKAREKEFILRIEDQGMGMLPEQVQKIFEKFYRGDAAFSSIEGTGLGMSIVKHIVDSHGGRVWVESERGKGTQVSVALPLVE